MPVAAHRFCSTACGRETFELGRSCVVFKNILTLEFSGEIKKKKKLTLVDEKGREEKHVDVQSSFICIYIHMSVVTMHHEIWNYSETRPWG
jgi:hypothetical protein